MRRPLLAALFVALFAGLATLPLLLRANAADAPATVTLTGSLIDTRCYSMDPANSKTSDHKTANGLIKQCARACASSGIPVALLSADDKVTILVAPSLPMAPHMGKEARVTGVPVLGGALRPTKLEVRKGKDGWETVNLAVMM